MELDASRDQTAELRRVILSLEECVKNLSRSLEFAQVVNKGPSTPIGTTDVENEMRGAQRLGNLKSGVTFSSSVTHNLCEKTLAQSISNVSVESLKDVSTARGAKGSGSPKSGVVETSFVPKRNIKVEPKIVKISCSRWNGSKLEYLSEWTDDTVDVKNQQSWLQATDIPKEMIAYHPPCLSGKVASCTLRMFAESGSSTPAQRKKIINSRTKGWEDWA
jgi:hypothetical protein